VKNFAEVAVSVTTFIYALGYLSWAFYSWARGFGLPPALEGQYLISGLMPAALLLVFWFALLGLRAVVRETRQEPTFQSKRWSNRLQIAGVVFLAVAFVLDKLGSPKGLGATLVGLGALVTGIAWSFSPKRTDRVFVRWTAWYLVVVAPVAFIALFMLFVTRVFPHLPSEFGGPAMKAVMLDLKKTELSADTLELLGATPSGGDETVRTGSVQVLMAPGDFYLVLIENGGKPTHVKMRADAVRAIVPNP
jgi:hypothetical protein